MSHRSNVSRERERLGRSFHNVQRAETPGSIPVDNFQIGDVVPQLMKLGVKPELRFGMIAGERPTVQILASIGPIHLPFNMSADQARQNAKALEQYADDVDLLSMGVRRRRSRSTAELTLTRSSKRRGASK